MYVKGRGLENTETANGNNSISIVALLQKILFIF